mgnify:CR=1 FL=1
MFHKHSLKGSRDGRIRSHQQQFQFGCETCGFKSQIYPNESGKKLMKKLHMKKCDGEKKSKLDLIIEDIDLIFDSTFVKKVEFDDVNKKIVVEVLVDPNYVEEFNSKLNNSVCERLDEEDEEDEEEICKKCGEHADESCWECGRYLCEDCEEMTTYTKHFENNTYCRDCLPDDPCNCDECVRERE